jgi:hypothetical protein
MRVDDSRLNHNIPVGNVHFENPVHAGQADDNAARGRQCAATQAGSSATAYKRDLVPCANADDCLDLSGASRQDHSSGKDAEIGQSVALIRLQLALAGNETVGADSRAQLANMALGKHCRKQLT